LLLKRITAISGPEPGYGKSPIQSPLESIKVFPLLAVELDSDCEFLMVTSVRPSLMDVVKQCWRRSQIDAIAAK